MKDKRSLSRIFMLLSLLFAKVLASENDSLNPTVTMATLRRVWRQGEKDTVHAMLSDLSSLQHLQGQCPLLTKTHSTRDSSYTVSWTNANWERHQVRSIHRYLRHLKSWVFSPTAGAVMPAVLVVVLWSCLVYYAAYESQALRHFLHKSSFALGLGAFSAPISLLLALRTNRALNRLLDARSQWGIMIRAIGSLGSLAATYVVPLDESKALLMGRYLSIYAWIMKGQMRDEDPTPVTRTALPPDEAAWLERAPCDTPTAVIFRLRQLVASMIGEIPRTGANALEYRLGELESVLGVCKRLLGSPIPPTYTRHTSRVLCLFLGLLPFALVGSKASFVAILLNVAALSYIFVGIDEIGVEIEHPFPLLPMFHLAKVGQKNVANQYILAYQLPYPPGGAKKSSD